MQPIQWEQPWLQPWREPGARLADAVAAGMPLPPALNTVQGVPVWFVPQSALPEGEAYERFIFSTGQCPTREGDRKSVV